MPKRAGGRTLPMLGFAAAWVVACFFAVAPVSAAVAFIAGAVGRPGLATVTAFAAMIDTMAVPRGEGWAFVAAVTVATALGAWLMGRHCAPAPVVPDSEDAS